nr:hypothetical protein CFP56_07840 [Quercus suber]
MPTPRQPASVQAAATTLLTETALLPADISARLGGVVSARTIRRWRLRREVFGEVYAPQITRNGPSPALTREQELVALAVWDQFEVKVHRSTINRVIHRHQWSRKVTRRRARDTSVPLRALWMTKAANWSIEQMVFIDESAANKRTGWRKRGYSPVGLSCTDLRSTKRSERWSVLPALTVDGYLLDSTLVYQGSISRDIYVE